MNALLAIALESHGGLDRWQRHRTLTATLVTGGGFWGLKGLVQDHVDVADGFAATQYVGDIVDVEGIKFPTRRRTYARGPGLHPNRDLLFVAIDLADLRFD